MTSQDGTGPHDPAHRRVGRRAVAAGAAWSVPVIAVGAAAPALAASVCPPIPPFSQANGWSLTTTGAGQSGSARFQNGQFVVDTDAAAGSTYTATASYPIPVVAGVSYTFVLAFTAYVVNSRPMTTVLRVGGTTIGTNPLITTSGLAVNNGSTTNHTSTRTATYVAPATGTVQISLVDSITSTQNTVGDDITVTSLTVGCS